MDSSDGRNTSYSDATPRQGQFDTPKISPSPGEMTPLRDHADSPKDSTDAEHSHTSSPREAGYDDDESYHNPEPPPELLQSHKELFEADTIGDTVFSKHWLFTTLMKLIEVVDHQNESKEALEPAEEDGGIDIDDALQDELCKLWDMSMNEHVVAFLQDFKAVEILTSVIAKSKAPRATEICVGILGNMACNEGAAQEMAANEKLRKLMLFLLGDSDAPTLVEVSRLLHCVISRLSSREPWLEAIKAEQAVQTNATFILTSSTNGDLIHNISEFIDKLLDLDEALCVVWSSTELIQAVLEAVKQVGHNPSETTDSLVHILQLVSTNEKGVQSLVEHAEDLCDFLMAYLGRLCSDEIVGVTGREHVFSTAFSVLNVIFASWDKGSSLVQDGYQLMRYTAKVLDVVYPFLHKEQLKQRRQIRKRSRTLSDCVDSPTRSTENNVSMTSEPNGDNEDGEGEGRTRKDSHSDASSHHSNSTSNYDETQMEVLYEVLQGFVVDIVRAFPKDDETPTPETLAYLESSCSRDRIYCLVWTLAQVKPSDSNDSLVAIIQDIAAERNLDRLSGIILDALKT